MKAPMIALEASTIIASDRAEQHGDIRRTFSTVAALWNTWLAHRRDKEAMLSPSDVAKMLTLLKMARTENGAFNIDDFVDLAGYAAIAGELEGMGL